MKNLPNGMYQYGNSVIHRMDITVKLVLFLILAAAVSAAHSPVGYAVMIVFVLFVLLLSRIGFRQAIGGIPALLWFFIVIFIMNLLFFDADHAWIRLWIFSPSYAGMLQGMKVVVRVTLFVLFSNILNSTTPPAGLTDAIENFLSPLSVFKVPVGQAALIISAAVQFIPVLTFEAQMIKKVQTARGAGFDSKRIFSRAKAVLPMLVPVFISAFRRADELALAMEARGCCLDKNNKIRKKFHMGKIEIISFCVCAALCALQIFVF